MEEYHIEHYKKEVKEESHTRYDLSTRNFTISYEKGFVYITKYNPANCPPIHIHKERLDELITVLLELQGMIREGLVDG